MDVEQRARELLAAEWKKQRDFGAPYSFATYMVEVIEKGEWDSAPDMCALVAALTPPEGHVVVTRNEAGQAVAVTRQDGDGRILSVIAEFEAPQGWIEQHERDSRELRSLCAARDEARKERDIAKNQLTRMRAALEKIAGYRLEQFSGPYDMASACVYDAENALPVDPEVP
ncbi:hypothetical protein AB9H29_12225 [Stenotrophomonas sepilia]|uniref:hypothetical protein n=1 Tax=Stenotrophomonas sepilia TaxID=2860290 RepID=UPI003558A00E